MNVLKKRVTHPQFGDGTITEQTETTITVQFSEEHGERKFVYPHSFESFLKLKSTSVRSKMEEEIRETNERLEAELIKRKEEAIAQMEEEKQELLKEKRAEAKKRLEAKKRAAKRAEKKQATKKKA